MRIVVVADNKIIPMSHLMTATLRTDLVPVPVTLEFTVSEQDNYFSRLALGSKIFVADYSFEFEIVKHMPVQTQTVKDGKLIGALACIAIPSAFLAMIAPTRKALCLENTSFKAVLRAIGIKFPVGTDAPLEKFIMLVGSLPSERLAVYLQQEALVMVLKKGKVHFCKVDSFLKNDAVTVIDNSAIMWVDNKHSENLEVSTFVSVDIGDSSQVNETPTMNRYVEQRPNLNARQLRNLERVLICRGTVIRPYDERLYAGETILIQNKKYTILTSANHTQTGIFDGNFANVTKLWIGSLHEA